MAAGHDSVPLSLAHLQELVAKGVAMGSLHVLAGPDHRKQRSSPPSLQLNQPTSLRAGHPQRRLLLPSLHRGRPMGTSDELLLPPE